MGTHRSLVLAAALVVAAGTLARDAIAAGPAPANDTAVTQRVDALMQQLTLDEKISLLGGVDSMFTRPIDRLHIPRVKMTDGPNGTRVWGKSTAYPAGVLLAATWDPALAQREGEQLGRDARARGCDVLLAPAMNIYRHPRNGRNFEYFGEDPLLAGEIAVGYVNGVQSQGVSATVKHFAANSQETDRSNMSAEMDERTLREIYLPAFRRVVTQANPGAVMCSYNRINGTFTSADHWLLTEVLRDEWKFDGVVMSDWGAVHGTIGPMLGGMDLEMPAPDNMNAAKIKPLLDSGVVTEATLDTKVRRLLTWEARFGWLDHDITDKSVPLDNPDGAKAALDIARAGLTLLKNDGNLLPLDKAKVRNIVVVGPGAADTPVGGGGSGWTDAFHSVSIADGLKAEFGKDHVTVMLADPFAKLAAAQTVDGGTFHAEYFANEKLEGPPAASRDEHRIDIGGTHAEPAPGGVPEHKFSARYRATITPQQTADYTFFTRSDDGSRVIVDGKAIVDDWSDHGARLRSAVVSLEAGKKHDVVVEYYDHGGAATLSFGCGVAGPAFDEHEQQQLREADAVIACVGYGPENEGEGSDRTYALPNTQDDLIATAIAANPKTIVVLNAGGSCDMTKWIDHVPALLHAFYAGQEGGTAIAEVLSGKTNPSGHLPFSIERQLADVPSEGNWGKEGTDEYAEGIFVGYRGYDHRKIEPRYPFGFGLSYTTFDVTTDDVRFDGHNVLVDVNVANTGSRDGATVVQVYAEPPATWVPRPVHELRGFQKVQLAAGEKKRVMIRVPREDLAYWDPVTRSWTITAGTYVMHVGTSSRTLPTAAAVEIH